MQGRRAFAQRVHGIGISLPHWRMRIPRAARWIEDDDNDPRERFAMREPRTLLKTSDMANDDPALTYEGAGTTGTYAAQLQDETHPLMAGIDSI